MRIVSLQARADKNLSFERT